MKFIGIDDPKMQHIVTVAHSQIVHKIDPGVQILLEALTVELSSRLAVCAGKAIPNRCLIRLNHRLLSANPGEIVQTYLHELAHIVANLQYKTNAGHGPKWKRVMEDLGVTDERCHTMDVTSFRKPVERYKYKCDCTWHLLSRAKHVRAQRKLFETGLTWYHCKWCKANLVEDYGE